MELLGVHKDASAIINVRSFLDGWDSSVIPGPDDDTSSSRKEIAVLSAEMQISPETVTELATVCGLVTISTRTCLYWIQAT